MVFSDYFRDNKEIIKVVPNKKFVVIIGSGFHREAYGKDVENILTSWIELLNAI